MSNLVFRKADIIEIPITPEMLQFAQENAHKGSMNQYSMLDGERNIEGLLGELAVHKYLPMLTYEPTKHHDFTFALKSGTLTIDAKNKFDVKTYVTPNLDWDCSIFGYEGGKKCHMYIFTSTDKNNTKVWIKGYVMKTLLVAPEKFYAAGSFRRTTQGSVQYKKDNYVVQVKELNRMDFLKNRLEEITKQQSQTGSTPQGQP